MKVFISWSGERSKRVASLLKWWLKCVIQASHPWISHEDMDRGTIWFSEISKALSDTTTGIICLTANNLLAPWILFEAGSLSNGLTSNRVCTFLVDVTPTDVKEPLAQFNHTTYSEESVWQLVETINKRLDDSALDKETLKRSFDTYWPQFQENFDKIITDTSESSASQGKPVRNENDILAEILSSVRTLDKRLRFIEVSSEERMYKVDSAMLERSDNFPFLSHNYENTDDLFDLVYEKFHEEIFEAALLNGDNKKINYIINQIVDFFHISPSLASEAFDSGYKRAKMRTHIQKRKQNATKNE